MADQALARANAYLKNRGTGGTSTKGSSSTRTSGVPAGGYSAASLGASLGGVKRSGRATDLLGGSLKGRHPLKLEGGGGYLKKSSQFQNKQSLNASQGGSSQAYSSSSGGGAAGHEDRVKTALSGLRGLDDDDLDDLEEAYAAETPMPEAEPIGYRPGSSLGTRSGSGAGASQFSSGTVKTGPIDAKEALMKAQAFLKKSNNRGSARAARRVNSGDAEDDEMNAFLGDSPKQQHSKPSGPISMASLLGGGSGSGSGSGGGGGFFKQKKAANTAPPPPSTLTHSYNKPKTSSHVYGGGAASAGSTEVSPRSIDLFAGSSTSPGGSSQVSPRTATRKTLMRSPVHTDLLVSRGSSSMGGLESTDTSLESGDEHVSFGGGARNLPAPSGSKFGLPDPSSLPTTGLSQSQSSSRRAPLPISRAKKARSLTENESLLGIQAPSQTSSRSPRMGGHGADDSLASSDSEGGERIMQIGDLPSPASSAGPDLNAPSPESSAGPDLNASRSSESVPVESTTLATSAPPARSSLLGPTHELLGLGRRAPPAPIGGDSSESASGGIDDPSSASSAPGPPLRTGVQAKVMKDASMSASEDFNDDDDESDDRFGNLMSVNDLLGGKDSDSGSASDIADEAESLGTDQHTTIPEEVSRSQLGMSMEEDIGHVSASSEHASDDKSEGSASGGFSRAFGNIRGLDSESESGSAVESQDSQLGARTPLRTPRESFATDRYSDDDDFEDEEESSGARNQTIEAQSMGQSLADSISQASFSEETIASQAGGDASKTAVTVEDYSMDFDEGAGGDDVSSGSATGSVQHVDSRSLSPHLSPRPTSMGTGAGVTARPVTQVTKGLSGAKQTAKQLAAHLQSKVLSDYGPIRTFGDAMGSPGSSSNIIHEHIGEAGYDRRPRSALAGHGLTSDASTQVSAAPVAAPTQTIPAQYIQAQGGPDMAAFYLVEEPASIAAHVIDPRTTQNLSGFYPSVVAANDLYKRHLALIRRFSAMANHLTQSIADPTYARTASVALADLPTSTPSPTTEPSRAAPTGTENQENIAVGSSGDGRPVTTAPAPQSKTGGDARERDWQYRYTTLNDTKRFIAQNRPKVRSVEEVLQEMKHTSRPAWAAGWEDI